MPCLTPFASSTTPPPTLRPGCFGILLPGLCASPSGAPSRPSGRWVGEVGQRFSGSLQLPVVAAANGARIGAKSFLAAAMWLPFSPVSLCCRTLSPTCVSCPLHWTQKASRSRPGSGGMAAPAAWAALVSRRAWRPPWCANCPCCLLLMHSATPAQLPGTTALRLLYAALLTHLASPTLCTAGRPAEQAAGAACVCA